MTKVAPRAPVKPTLAQLRELKRRLDAERAKLAPFGDPLQRLSIRDGILALQKAIASRRSHLMVRVRECDRMMATVGKPWAASAPPIPMIVWALLCHAGGRVWAYKLLAVARVLFELDKALVWTAIRGFERQNLMRVHRPEGHEDGAWIELLAATGGDGVPPPAPHAKRMAAKRSEAA